MKIPEVYKVVNMAEPSPWHSDSRMNQESAVLDLEGVEMTIEDDTDTSDYETNISGSKQRQENTPNGPMDDMKQRMTENVSQMVWDAGKKSARKAWSMYGNIDILRPYFDVEPEEVQRRLIFSLIPQKPSHNRQRVPKELYGPLMVIFTLIALLLYQMKLSSHKVQEGTLMGSALLVCFSYWLGVSSLVWFLSYVCNIRLALLQVLSMLGYGLFGHCVVLFLGTIVHTSHDHALFYLLWATIGGLSTLKMVCIILSRSSGKTEKLVVVAVIASVHLLFLLYLHFAYHTVVEELSDMFDTHVHQPIQPAIAQRIAEQGLEKNVENAAQNVFEKVTKKVGEALQDGGQLLVNQANAHVQSANNSVHRVLRETLPGKPVEKLAQLVNQAVGNVIASNATKIL